MSFITGDVATNYREPDQLVKEIGSYQVWQRGSCFTVEKDDFELYVTWGGYQTCLDFIAKQEEGEI